MGSLSHIGMCEPVVLPPRSPHLNAYCERCVRSIKEEALDRRLMLGERSLQDVIQQDLARDYTERDHQSLHNQRITAESGIESQSGQVKHRERLGGLLRYDYRDAA